MNLPEDFVRHLLATFSVQAAEHVSALTAGLVELEKGGTEVKQDVLETVFREAHSLKGAAGAVNVTDIAATCQVLESAFAALKRREMVPSAALFDALHKSVDALQLRLMETLTESGTSATSSLSDANRKLELVLAGAPAPAPAAADPPGEPQVEATSPTKEKPQLVETVRISTARLESLLLQTEELLGAKLAAIRHASDLRGLCAELAAWKKRWGQIRLSLRSLQSLVENSAQNGKAGRDVAKLLGFLEWNESHFGSLEDRIGQISKTSAQESRLLGGMVDNLLEDMKKAFMLPVATVAAAFPRLARDLARDRGKEVNLEIAGDDVTVDRRVLEEMKDPLIHLLRNSIDHGIEVPELRLRQRKPAEGMIRLVFRRRPDARVEMTFSDDGAGIDLDKVKQAAMRSGVVSPEESNALSVAETMSLIFHSGVSTSPRVTDLSGLGLGLAIVREKVEKLDGSISLESSPGQGTEFRIVLPLTLSTFRGILVRIGDRLFVVPTTRVERVFRFSSSAIKTAGNRETVEYQGQTFALARLSDALDLSQEEVRSPASDRMSAFVIGTGERRIAFAVDEVLAEDEVLVKGLGSHLQRVRNLAGATVLSTGVVVPILSVPDLLQSAARLTSLPRVEVVAGVEGGELRRKRILVVEDSITARTLLKSILESAGYEVKAAVDGMEAFTTLKTEDFSLVVSDVDMPRMNGFDLTARIRADRELQEVPVILVTALESREDRERGIDVGASAYIVKSSFDQGDLLAAIRRLI